MQRVINYLILISVIFFNFSFSQDVYLSLDGANLNYNSTSDILNTEVRAKLPLYVKFLNNIHPKNSYLSYDPETREVIWKYKKIEAFIGYRTEPKKVYFQIEYIPTAPHSGNILVILHNIKLLTKDSFTEKLTLL